MYRILLLVVFALTTLQVAAEEHDSIFNFGGDVFTAGSTVTYTGEEIDDLFMAGDTLELLSDVTGSAYAAGRRVRLQGSIGQDVHAAGMNVSLTKPIGGDANLVGYRISLDGSVGGDLRASGSTVTVNAPVTGYALLAGETVNINGAITGDVSLAAEAVNFGADARIDGQLILYEETPGELNVPEHVVPQSRLDRRDVEQFDEHPMGDMLEVVNWRRAILNFLAVVLIVAAIAALLAGFAPQHLANMRRKILNTPFRTLGLGFLAQSAVMGSAILFAMTVIGLFFTPASILLALILGFLGYVIGAYAFGVGLLLALGRSEPDTFGDRALAAGIGALVAGLLALIPFLGWLFVLALVLAGIGAITTRMFRPVFFVD